MLNILGTYEVKLQLDMIPASGVYDWEATKQSPFTKELHEMARRELGKDIKITYRRFFELAVLALIAFT